MMLSSQLKPVNSGAQVHSYVLGELLHIPSLRQGSERHIFISISQLLPCMCNGKQWHHAWINNKYAKENCLKL